MKRGWFLVVGLALVLAVVSLAGCSEGLLAELDRLAATVEARDG